MAKLCQYCGKREATMHFTDMKDGKKTEVHICKQCAQERGSELAFPALLTTIMKGGAGVLPRSETEAVPAFCPKCGLSYNEFKARGRLGCPSCYDAFKPVLGPLLEKVHGTSSHKGKAPERLRNVLASRRELQELEDQLAIAVTAEDYESAARLRDRIREFRGGEHVES